APINDLYNLLRLLVYPADRIAYAALLRSPFMRLSGLTLAVCMLDEGGLPFNDALDDRLPAEELARYQEARGRYRALTASARTLSLTALLTKLWYEEGYRYETTWSASAQIYGELFDLFFELARNTENQGGTLVDFVDYLEDLREGEEKLDDLDVPVEGTAGVRIMSIHKSKGLEFPVVFVYSCGSRGAYRTEPLVYFSETFGVTLNLPQAEELPGDRGNYFFNRQKAEEEEKNTAELRRLLYVAMTRAENALFVTASLPERTGEDKAGFDPEDGEYTSESLKLRLLQLYAKKENKAAASFLDLLLPVLVGSGDPPFVIRSIPVRSRTEIRELNRTSGAAFSRMEAPLSPEEAAEAAASFYAAADCIADPPRFRSLIPAGSLYCQDTTRAGEDEDDLSRLLKKTRLSPADFGILVHGFVEARLSGREPPRLLPAEPEEKDALLIQAAVQEMGERFFASGLGRQSLQAAYRETEFPVITHATVGEKTVTLTGRIDLLFEWEGVIQVVDFKTDRTGEAENHLGQLAVYARAAGDIFGKPVRSWVFFFRTGRAVELTAKITETSVEDAV
ncbi:MAG: PD-(D/E)XK nuclease family protein, partial [Spirochaetaceae bacterium]|nr:PD-(D/E)XK nuclease family protein [Spirochaetaceae bacterium]